MLGKARRAAAAESLEIRFDRGDAEHLPYEDAVFAVVSSCFGVIFAPDPKAAAGELARVCRRGGRLGLTAWVPSRELDALYAPYSGEAPRPDDHWGEEAPLRALLDEAFELEIESDQWVVEGASGEEIWELWRIAVPPFKALLRTLDAAQTDRFQRDFVAYCERHREGEVVRERRAFLRILGSRR